ncbi:MAG: YcaO-like family protein [Haloarculaceae archaeon]
MIVGIVGTGPAAAAVEAALTDVEVRADRIDVGDVDAVDLAVVVARTGDAVFERANERAIEAERPWIAAELGGVGSYPLIEAAIAGLAPSGPCYDCLAGRVAANRDPDAEATAAPAAHTVRFAGAVAGRAAARLVRGADRSILGTVVEVDGPRRQLLTLPGCDCSSGVGAELPREDVTRDLDAALGRAEGGLDERVGIVQDVGEAESFPVPYYLARSCDTGGFSDATASRDAAGVAAGWDAAFMKALGEALERYCAGVYRTAPLETAPPSDLEQAVPPSAFVCESTPGADEARTWIAGEDLATGDDVLLPAELVLYPPPAERIRPAITTGLGLGNGGIEAVLAGLSEVIERDAAMLAWYATFDPLELTVDDEAFAELVGRARSEGLSVTPLLLTQDVDVPVVAACVHRDEWPRFAVGSAANMDASQAATAALAEALQNWVELRGMGPDDAAEASGRIGYYADLPDAAAAFIDVDAAVPAASVGPAEPPTGAEAMEELLDRLAMADLSAYAARLTTRDVDSLGFEAVRVLVPAAQPLFFGDPYFGERARSVPASLGFDHAPDRPHHPFP